MSERESVVLEGGVAKEGFSTWPVSLVNFFISTASMACFILIPLMGAQLGASDFEVGLMGSVYGTTFLISSLVSGWKSDQFGRLLFVRWGLLISSAAFAAQLLADSVFVLIAVRGLVGFSLGISTAATIAYAFESEADMGKFSSYGSLGWIFGALAVVILKEIHLVFWGSFGVCFLAFCVSLFFRKVPTQHFSRPPNLWHVLRRDYKIYLAVFLRHMGATAVWIIFPLYLVSIGFDNFWIGLFWGINFSVQFLVMRQLVRFSELKMFFLGQLLSVPVFIAYAFVTSKLFLIMVQIVMGVAWSFLYVGALVIVLKSGKEKGTAGGLFTSTLNLCNAIGPFLGGLIAQGWGYQGVMLFAAALSAAGMLVAIPQRKE